MRSTYFQRGDAYANALFASAELTSDSVRVHVAVPRILGRLFGVTDSTISLAEIESIEILRHPVSRMQRTKVTTPDVEYRFSAWVGEELLRLLPQRATPVSP